MRTVVVAVRAKTGEIPTAKPASRFESFILRIMPSFLTVESKKNFQATSDSFIFLQPVMMIILINPKYYGQGSKYIERTTGSDTD
jgi:hypothetical protein